MAEAGSLNQGLTPTNCFKELRGLADLICFCLLLVVCFQTVWILKDPKGSNERQEEQMKLIYNAVLASSILLWPLVFDVTIGLHKLFTSPNLIIGFFWPIIISMTELNYVSQFSTSTGKNGKNVAWFQQRDLNADTGAVISAAFAMGSLLMGTRKNKGVNSILMYALLFCVAFLVPTLQVPPETKEGVMWRSVQKVILNYAIGFTISGISVDIFLDNSNGNSPATLAGGGGDQTPVLAASLAAPVAAPVATTAPGLNPVKTQAITSVPKRGNLKLHVLAAPSDVSIATPAPAESEASSLLKNLTFS